MAARLPKKCRTAPREPLSSSAGQRGRRREAPPPLLCQHGGTVRDRHIVRRWRSRARWSLKYVARASDAAGMQATFAGVLGAIFGSFLNVVAYRLPRHESLLGPASHCRSCGTPVKPYDNIPILSFLLLRGHCRSCGSSISPRYPLVEALTAALCAGAVLAHGSASAIALSLALILLVVPAALIDLEHRIIPNSLTA